MVVIYKEAKDGIIEMNKRIIGLAVLFSWICFSCPILTAAKYTPPPTDGVVNEYDKDGNVATEFSYVSGVLRRTRIFQNKILLKEIEFNNAGLPMNVKENYASGKRKMDLNSSSPGNSITKVYYEDGSLEEEAMSNNYAVVESKNYYSNGKLRTTMQTKQGGIEKKNFDENGNLILVRDAQGVRSA